MIKWKVTVMVCLDISNAFNSIPWKVIMNAMKKKELPGYLIRIISSYLSNRYITYVNSEGKVVKQEITRGVPQGSAFGPTLWNIGYDSVVANLPSWFEVVCYANDTAILVSADSVDLALHNAGVATELIVGRIESLGLCVASQKTEVTMFPFKNPDSDKYIIVKRQQVNIKNSVKYLGVILDSRLSFYPHIVYSINKAEKVINKLRGLRLNTRGPSEKKRKLYGQVALSILTYGSPIWAEEISSNVTARKRLLEILQTIAQRIVCAYRTVSSSAYVIGRLPIG
jgi:hypothetical protein